MVRPCLQQQKTQQHNTGIQLNEKLKPFYYGVASGDPLTDRVIIWTKVEPRANNEETTVQWQVSADSSFTTIQSAGSALAVPGSNYTVKVDVDGLYPNTYYYYRFKDKQSYSTVGRTKTLPADNKKLTWPLPPAVTSKAGTLMHTNKFLA
ncbi:MAG: hypothetical protein HC896_01845 [Bacteroidales bacterium]|nr:hypothetical protein [Bacteroidales bacterium]